MPNFQTSNLQNEILAVAGSVVPDDGLVVAVVGDGSVSFLLGQTFAAQTTTLLRRPAGSAATSISNAITFDVSGFYTVTVAAGGYTRTITVVCFPAAVLTVKAPSSQGVTIGRTTLAALIRDPRVTPANITTAMEEAATFTVGALVGGSAFTWNAYFSG